MSLPHLALPSGTSTTPRRLPRTTEGLDKLQKADARRFLVQMFNKYGLGAKQVSMAYDKGLGIFQGLAGVHKNSEVLNQLNSKQWASLAVFVIMDSSQNGSTRSRAFIAKMVDSFFAQGGNLTPKQATQIGKQLKPYGWKNRLENYRCSEVPDTPYQIN